MRKFTGFLLIILSLTLPLKALAILSMELTQGVAGAIPIAIIPFESGEALVPQDVAKIIITDLKNSGRFKVYDKNALPQFPSTKLALSGDYFRRLGVDDVLIGKISVIGPDRYQMSFQLLDTFKSKEGSNVALQKSFTLDASDLRRGAHHISDLVYEKLTGVRGIFSTRLAYILVQHDASNRARYILEVSDQDGYNPKPLLTSDQPIMSPSWSPNGKQIAYVSFEDHRAGIYLEDVAAGTRRLLSVFPGINGAPAWSPDGSKMALVLSKSGSPNIYIMDMTNRRLKAVTNDGNINTEPAWSYDGKTLLFTSNRTGNPQIYQVNLATNSISRVSYAGDYNARASYTRDGKYIAMIHRVSSTYNIGLLNLGTGTTRVLSTATGGDSASPSIAPNGSMILYDTVYRGQNVLAMVSVDGRVQLVLPERNGEAQDPAWSPFLS